MGGEISIWYFSGIKIKNPLQPIDCKGHCVVERGGIEPPSKKPTSLVLHA
jgi:hypothetical protein